MQLPRVGEAFIAPVKLTGYLLDPGHPSGGGKASFFLARGFRADAPDVFERALLEHPLRNKAILCGEDAFGPKVEVRCTLRTPDGRDPCVRSFWRLAEGGEPYLVTAYAAG